MFQKLPYSTLPCGPGEANLRILEKEKSSTLKLFKTTWTKQNLNNAKTQKLKKEDCLRLFIINYIIMFKIINFYIQGGGEKIRKQFSYWTKMHQFAKK